MIDFTQAKPLQAAFASGMSFVAGGIFPFLIALIAPMKHMVIAQYLFTLITLATLASVSAKTGGASPVPSILRICFRSTIAMGITAPAGYIFGVNAV